MGKSREVKLGLVQMTCSGDTQGNLDKAIKNCRQLAADGAQIICFQELFNNLYFCQKEDADLFDLAEAIPGPTTEILQAVAKEEGVVIVASLFEKRAPGLYHNTTAVIDADGSYLGKYRKMHIPDDPNYYEKFYFTPGDMGFKVFDTKFAKIGVLICWDQWFPEGARLTALQGAEIIFYPTAIGWLEQDKKVFGDKQYNAWQRVQVGHAIANEVFVASPNRVGREGNIEFWGGSFVADPFGEIVHKASHTDEENILVSCDLNRIEEHRRGWPFLRDRRIDAYDGLLKRFGQD
ncbi:MAG: carbon-nitrogen hydrolase [Deltaproteobacteria bacterium]|nr:carbon-nitrogen hydrolase [Deltaproteobacteria bacterium]